MGGRLCTATHQPALPVEFRHFPSMQFSFQGLEPLRQVLIQVLTLQSPLPVGVTQNDPISQHCGGHSRHYLTQ